MLRVSYCIVYANLNVNDEFFQAWPASSMASDMGWSLWNGRGGKYLKARGWWWKQRGGEREREREAGSCVQTLLYQTAGQPPSSSPSLPPSPPRSSLFLSLPPLLSLPPSRPLTSRFLPSSLPASYPLIFLLLLTLSLSLLIYFVFVPLSLLLLLSSWAPPRINSYDKVLLFFHTVILIN